MNTRIWFNTTTAAEHVDRHPDTVLKALQSGELHGGQSKAGGRWAVHVDCLDAWAVGEPCPRHGDAGAA